MKHAMNPQNPTKSLCGATTITAENVALNPSQITCKRCLKILHNSSDPYIQSALADVEMQDEMFESQLTDELPDFSQSTCPIDGRVGHDCRLCITCSARPEGSELLSDLELAEHDMLITETEPVYQSPIDPTIIADFTAIQHDESDLPGDEALVKFAQAEQAKAPKAKKFKAPRICYHGETPTKGLCNIPGSIQTVHIEDVTCKVCLSKMNSKGTHQGRMHYNHSGSTLCSMIIPSPLNFTRDRHAVTCKVCLKMLEDI